MWCTLVWVIVLFLWGSVVRRVWTLGDGRDVCTILNTWVYDVNMRHQFSSGVCISKTFFCLRHTPFLTFRPCSGGYFSISMLVFCTFFWSFWHLSFCLHDLFFCSWSIQCACFLTTAVISDNLWLSRPLVMISMVCLSSDILYVGPLLAFLAALRQ